MSKSLYLQPSSGIAGNMFSAALLDLILNQEMTSLYQAWQSQLQAFIEQLGLSSQAIKIELSAVRRKGFQARHLYFRIEAERKSNNITEIQTIIKNSELNENIRRNANNIFLTLAKAEAKVHGIPIEKVHFHEAGSLDSILDVISACILVDLLEVNEVFYSEIALSNKGVTKFSHGEVALPVPAVVELLRNTKVQLVDENSELTTPTGASILMGLNASSSENLKSGVKILNYGFGAGTRELTNRANMLRVNLINIS